jgi:hypothetical protein
MEKFMLIFKGGFYDDANLSPDEVQAKMGEWYKWVQDLQAKNIYGGGEPLLKEGKIVKKNGSSFTVTDGPFPESKELVGGYFVITAKDYNEASEIAKNYPDFDLGGSVEVRQVMKIDM